MCHQAFGGTGIAQRFRRLGYDVKTTIVVSTFVCDVLSYCGDLSAFLSEFDSRPRLWNSLLPDLKQPHLLYS